MVKKLSYPALVKLIRAISLQHPGVNDFYLDRYKLSSVDDITYAAIVLTTNTISVSDNVTVASLNLLYADRLTETRDNCLQVQGEGLRVLCEIINALRNFGQLTFIVEDSYTVQFFKEGFADSTAGAWAQLSVSLHSETGSCDWLDKSLCECELNTESDG